MSVTVSNQYGKIIYDENVISLIAGQAAAECYGLAGMANKSAGTGIANFFKGQNANKGVEVDKVDDETVRIRLFITAKYGVSLPAVAENVIDKVKFTVENDTGVHVQSVDLMVQSIQV